jgi:hypothetical protein
MQNANAEYESKIQKQNANAKSKRRMQMQNQRNPIFNEFEEEEKKLERDCENRFELASLMEDTSSFHMMFFPATNYN